MDLQKIITSFPVDKTAKIVTGRGEAYDDTLHWAARVQLYDTCPPLSPLKKNCKDYTGVKKGRLTVIGYMGPGHKHSRWACRCQCGLYTIRSGRTISRFLAGKTQDTDMCSRCDKVERKKRTKGVHY